MRFNNERIHRSWNDFFNDENVSGLIDTIERQLENTVFYPYEDQVFRFAWQDVDNVKSVIVGMDPYPSWNDKNEKPQATGRSFEVSELEGKGWDYKIRQSSLRNILKAIYYNETGENVSMEELRQDIVEGRFNILPPTLWFDDVEEQGVLFLNSTLTVKPNKPGSHVLIWKDFRKALVDFLIGRNISWHLWGNNASNEYGALLKEGEHVLTAPHPRMASFVQANTFAQDPRISWKGRENS